MKRIHSRKHSACCSTASTVHPYTWPAKAHKAMQYNPPPNTNHYKNSLQCEQHEQSTCFCTNLPTRHAETSTISNQPTNYNSANTVAAILLTPCAAPCHHHIQERVSCSKKPQRDNLPAHALHSPRPRVYIQSHTSQVVIGRMAASTDYSRAQGIHCMY